MLRQPSPRSRSIKRSRQARPRHSASLRPELPHQPISGGKTEQTSPAQHPASYTTPATTTADNGSQFSCVVTNAAGSVTSNNAILTVTLAQPTITSQPASITITEGQPANFSITATGSGTLTYQWLRNGTNISGATSATYSLPAPTITDSGAVFSCVVSNSAGSVTSANATLTVQRNYRRY